MTITNVSEAKKVHIVSFYNDQKEYWYVVLVVDGRVVSIMTPDQAKVLARFILESENFLPAGIVTQTLSYLLNNFQDEVLGQVASTIRDIANLASVSNKNVSRKEIRRI